VGLAAVKKGQDAFFYRHFAAYVPLAACSDFV